jgi:ABC-type uncharacterized transport system permease subunit
MASPDVSPLATADDPVRKRRRMIDRWNRVATRVGYLMYLVAIVMFFVALNTTFSDGKVSVITASMLLGSILLVPAIVLGYAVKAAERDDRSKGI